MFRVGENKGTLRVPGEALWGHGGCRCSSQEPGFPARVDFLTSALSLSSFFFPSDSESPFSFLPQALFVPLCYVPSGQSSLPAALWAQGLASAVKGPGSGRPGPTASEVRGPFYKESPARLEEGGTLPPQQGRSQHPPAAQFPLTAEQPSPWLTSAFQGLQRSRGSMPKRCS